MIVAIADGRVVGEMILRVMTREDDGFWKKRRWLYIDDLCVDAAWRGMGVAEKLDAFAEEIARSEDCVSIELNCWAFNERAAAFYKRMGYRPQKTEYEKILNDGKNDQ